MQGALYNVLFNWMILLNSSAEFDGTQKNFRYQYFFRTNFSVTGTGTFFGTKFFRYRYQFLFSGPIFSGTTQNEEYSREFSGTGTKFPGIFRYWYQILPVPIPLLFPGPVSVFFSDTKFFRYLDHPKRKIFSSEWPPTPKI